MATIQEQAEAQKKAAMDQFSQSRRRLGGSFREAKRQSQTGIRRLQATTGNTGGALAKAQQMSLRELARQRGDLEAGVGAQEAATMRAIEQEAGQKEFARQERTGSQEFARQERLGSQEFAGSEAEKARAQEMDQFKQTLAFQKDSLAQQMSFQWAEFDENKRTNMLNASIALKEAGIKSAGDWAKLSNAMNVLYPGQFPKAEFDQAAASEGVQRQNDRLAALMADPQFRNLTPPQQQAILRREGLA